MLRRLFVHELDKQTNPITQNNNKSGPKNRLNRSEIITIIIGYRHHMIALRTIICNRYGFIIEDDFRLVSYSQFIKIIGPHLLIIVKQN